MTFGLAGRARVALVFAALASPLGFHAAAAADGPPADATIRIETRTFKHLGEVPAGAAGEPLVLDGRLRFPAEARDRYPAVVILHTIGGYREANEGWAAEQYRKAGFATLTYESISTRGVRDAPTKGAGALWGSLVADGFAALATLAAHPRIDPGRIAATGYSLGAEVTRLLAFETLRRALVAGELRYAAHVAVYPCHMWAPDLVDGSLTGAPVLEQVGEKDDCGPVAKAQALIAAYKAKTIAAPVTVALYEGAYHSWTVPDFRNARYFPNHASPSKCPFLVVRPGSAFLDPDGTVRPFSNDELTACTKASKGYTQGYDARIREKSFADGVAFLRNSLKL